VSKEMKDTKEVKELSGVGTKIIVGEIFDTLNYGRLIVTEYKDSYNLKVKFMETGYETVTKANQLRKGEVKDRLLPSVYGVGIIGDTVTKVNGKTLKEYILWKSMLCRCYDIKYSNKYPTYQNSEVSDSFKYFPYFKEWCNKQIGYDQQGWALDKDILVKGNKLYSEDTCCFVPKEINNLLVKCDSSRGEYPVGVRYRKRFDKFESQVTLYGKMVYLGTFNTPEEAFCAYKEVKEAYIKDVADKWKDRIDPRVYDALMNYQVEITD